MSDESKNGLPDVETTEEDKRVKPKRKLNKLHVVLAVFAALIVIIAFLFKSLESSSKAPALNESVTNGEGATDSLNDSVLSDLINNSSAQTNEESVVETAEVTESPAERVAANSDSTADAGLASNEIKKVVSEVIATNLGDSVNQTKREVAQLAETLASLQEQQSKLIRVLNAISTQNQQFKNKTESQLNNLMIEIEKIRVGVNKVGGEVKKDNSAFKLIVWGRETYAGEVSVSVSTNEAPKDYKSLSVGDSLSGWRVKEIRSDEVDFVNSNNETWTEGL